MYHPAAALRQQSLKETMLVDMCGLPDVLLQARAGRRTAVTPEPVVQPVAQPVAEAVTITSPAAASAPIEAPVPEPELAAPVEAEPALVTEIPVAADDLVIPIEAAAVVATAPSEPQLELFG